jgi:hypothetical protein
MKLLVDVVLLVMYRIYQLLDNYQFVFRRTITIMRPNFRFSS